MKPLAPGRTRCCVPYCGRTFKIDGGSETICGKHWRMVPKVWRMRYSRILRSFRHEIAKSDDIDRFNRLQCLLDVLWERIKERSIAVAMGCGK